MLTEKQKAYHRESYAWYKARVICTDCGKQYSEPNRVKCADCLEKDRLRSQRRSLLAELKRRCRLCLTTSYRHEKIEDGEAKT